VIASNHLPGKGDGDLLLASRKPSRCPAGGFAAEREPYNCA